MTLPGVGAVLEAAALMAVAAAALATLGAYRRTGAPPVPSSAAERAHVVRLLAEAGLPPNACIYELGCGWGGLAIAMARAFPDARVVGVELSPLPWLVARLRACFQPNLEVRRADFHDLAGPDPAGSDQAERTPTEPATADAGLAADLCSADAVACYLMIEPMVRLARTLDRALRPGTAVVALAFLFRDREPARVLRGEGVRVADAALYRWPARRAS